MRRLGSRLNRVVSSLLWPTGKGLNYVFEKATFYQEYVVIEQGSRQGCCPIRYTSVVLPKYKLCGARVNKAAKGYSLALFGIGAMVGGLICVIVGASGASMIMSVGIILLIVGFICLLFPCCLTRYETELKVLIDPEDPALGVKTYQLRTFQKPDDDFVLLYVYGAVVDGMAGYHALAHLIDDNLVQKVQPLEMTAINVEAGKLPSSNLLPIENKRRSTHATNAGYGKQLYVLEQATGIFGEEGGLLYKLGTSISKTVTRAVFCENLIVLQIEKKLLCYPMTYEKLVIPKYKVAQVEFSKGGLLKKLLAFSWFALWIGVVLVAIGATTGQASSAISTISGQANSAGSAGTGLIVGGVVVAVVALLLSIMACCHSTYEVLLVFIQPPLPPGLMNPFKKMMKRMMGPESYSLILHDEPHKEFIMSYVYGTLGENMGGYHALTHLIKDNLVDKVKPFTISGAIASTGKASYVPVPVKAGQVDVQVEAA